MTHEDIEQLLAPISEDNPSGENLEYEAAFLDLEREAAGKEERYSGGQLIPAQPPNWKVVREMAAALLAKGKDLRVAVHLAHAEAALNGLSGLVRGLHLVRGVAERFWADVHPRLAAGDGYDPFFRINAVANLAGETGLPKILRQTYLVEERSVGRFTFRDLDVAEERISPLADETPPTLNLMKVALREAGSDYASAQLALLTSAKAHLDAIDEVFRDRTGGSSPDLDALTDLIGHGIAYLSAGVVLPGAETGDAPDAATVDQSGPSVPALSGEGNARGGFGPLRTRADVKHVLEEVCQFLERTEPSNPAPLLIRRAQRLIDRNFMDIIQDLAPEAFANVEALAGNRGAESAP